MLITSRGGVTVTRKAQLWADTAVMRYWLLVKFGEALKKVTPSQSQHLR